MNNEDILKQERLNVEIKPKLPSLFDDYDDKYENEWKNMPEFLWSPETPTYVLTINIKTKDDLMKFMDLIGQKFRPKTFAYWYPKLSREVFSDLKYYDSDNTTTT